jgi:hypothetical protein
MEEKSGAPIGGLSFGTEEVLNFGSAVRAKRPKQQQQQEQVLIIIIVTATTDAEYANASNELDTVCVHRSIDRSRGVWPAADGLLFRPLLCKYHHSYQK